MRTQENQLRWPTDCTSAAGDIVQTERHGEAMLALRSFMFDAVYLRSESESERRRVAHVVDGPLLAAFGRDRVSSKRLDCLR